MQMFWWPFFLIPATFGLLAAVISIAAMVFWVVMLVDVIKRNFKNPNDRLLWVLIILFAHIIGAIIYYFLIVKKK